MTTKALVKSCNICLVWSCMPGHIASILQNNKATISPGRVELFVCFLHVVTHPWKLQCFSVGYGPACPKFSEITNHQYLWKELSDFVIFLHIVICILLDIHWSYQNMLFCAAHFARHSLSANQILRCFKLKKLENHEVSSWFFAFIKARKNVMLFWVMTIIIFWLQYYCPIRLQDFLLLTYLAFKS